MVPLFWACRGPIHHGRSVQQVVRAISWGELKISWGVQGRERDQGPNHFSTGPLYPKYCSQTSLWQCQAPPIVPTQDWVFQHSGPVHSPDPKATTHSNSIIITVFSSFWCLRSTETANNINTNHCLVFQIISSLGVQFSFSEHHLITCVFKGVWIPTMACLPAPNSHFLFSVLNALLVILRGILTKQMNRGRETFPKQEHRH